MLQCILAIQILDLNTAFIALLKQICLHLDRIVNRDRRRRSCASPSREKQSLQAALQQRDHLVLLLPDCVAQSDVVTPV
jgi:hypothetical protein